MPPGLLERALEVIHLEAAAPTDRLELMGTLIRALDTEQRDASAVRTLARATLLALADRLEGRPERRLGVLKRFESLNVS